MKKKGRGRKIDMSISDRVREVARGLGEFCSRDLVYADYGCYFSRSQIGGAFGGLRRTGEIVEIGQGRYCWTGKKKERTKLDIVWHLIRSHRSFETDEIERLSGAARITVLGYLHCFRKAGYVRQVRRGHWKIEKDPGPKTPISLWECRKRRIADEG